MDGPFGFDCWVAWLCLLPSPACHTDQPNHRADAEQRERGRLGTAVSVIASTARHPWLMLISEFVGVKWNPDSFTRARYEVTLHVEVEEARGLAARLQPSGGGEDRAPILICHLGSRSLYPPASSRYPRQ